MRLRPRNPVASSGPRRPRRAGHDIAERDAVVEDAGVEVDLVCRCVRQRHARSAAPIHRRGVSVRPGVSLVDVVGLRAADVDACAKILPLTIMPSGDG